MHIILGFLALLGAAAFWYYRLRQAGEVAGEVIDAAQRARGYWRRKKFLSKVEGSVVTAIEDPVVAAIVMMVSIASLRGHVSEAAATIIRDEHGKISGRESSEDYVFAKWVVDQSPDADNIVLKLSKLWNDKLDPAEKREFIDMLLRVAEADGETLPVQQQCIRRLRERLNV